MLNKTLTCDLSLEAFWPPVCTMWLITTVQIHQVICPTPLGEKTSWQPVSCVLSLEWSHCSPAPNIRARHPEVLRVPYSQKDAHSLQYKKKEKDKLFRKDSNCLHMYFKPSMKNDPFQKTKNRYKSGFCVFVFFLKSRASVLLFLSEKTFIC